jgi:O-methyltransferase involved in polyketide biosynthesis
VTSYREAARGIDNTVAHSARVYDWWLGGKDNFAADRELGQYVVDLVPMTRASARANRAFLHRAARLVAEAGVTQFLDLGAGLPTADNTHSVVQRVAAANRVVYVDCDPLVIAHARALLAGYGPTTAVQADIRDPEAMLAHPEVTGFLDLTKPICVLAVAVLHFLTDDEPYAVVARLHEAMTPGSYLVVSHITGDGTSQAEADEVASIMRKGMADPPTLRSHAEIRRFFDSFDLLDPGVVPVHRWRPDSDDLPARQRRTAGADDGSFWMYAGVGRVADRSDQPATPLPGGEMAPQLNRDGRSQGCGARDVPRSRAGERPATARTAEVATISTPPSTATIGGAPTHEASR